MTQSKDLKSTLNQADLISATEAARTAWIMTDIDRRYNGIRLISRPKLCELANRDRPPAASWKLSLCIN